jgi:hypothetical protein
MRSTNEEQPSWSSLCKKCWSCAKIIIVFIGGGFFITLLGFNYYAASKWDTIKCSIKGFDLRIWLLLYASTELSMIIFIGYAYLLRVSLYQLVYYWSQNSPRTHTGYEYEQFGTNPESSFEACRRNVQDSAALFWARATRVLLILFLFITGSILVNQCEFGESLLKLSMVDLVLMGITLYGVLTG